MNGVYVAPEFKENTAAATQTETTRDRSTSEVERPTREGIASCR